MIGLMARTIDVYNH